LSDEEVSSFRSLSTFVRRVDTKSFASMAHGSLASQSQYFSKKSKESHLISLILGVLGTDAGCVAAASRSVPHTSNTSTVIILPTELVLVPNSMSDLG
jgi:hypothetical protein